MNGWLRRVRGAIGMGLMWGAAWLGAGLVMMVGALLLTGSTGADVPYPLGFGALGFLAGTTFSSVLGLVEGRRRFDEMSLPRFTGWGAVGGFLLSTIFVVTVTLVDDPAFIANLPMLGTIFAGAGAVCAGGALTLARRAERRMLEAGEDPTGLGASRDSTRDLLERGE